MPPTATRALLLLFAVLAAAAVASGCGESSDSRERAEGRRMATERTPSPTPPAKGVRTRSSASGRVAFSAGTHPHTDIDVVNTDGSALERLTSGGRIRSVLVAGWQADCL